MTNSNNNTRPVAPAPIFSSEEKKKMLAYASDYRVLKDAIMLIAILQQGGINAFGPSWKHPERPDWRKLAWTLPPEAKASRSDWLAQLAIFKMAERKDKTWMRENGIYLGKYFAAKKAAKELTHHAKCMGLNFEGGGTLDEVVKSILAGMDFYASSFRVYMGYYDDWYHHTMSIEGEDPSKEAVFFGRASVIERVFYENREDTYWVSLEREIPSRWIEERTTTILEVATEVRPEWLEELSGLEVRFKELDQCYWIDRDTAMRREERYLCLPGGKEIYLRTIEEEGDPTDPKAIDGMIAFWKEGEKSFFSDLKKAQKLGAEKKWCAYVHEQIVERVKKASITELQKPEFLQWYGGVKEEFYASLDYAAAQALASIGSWEEYPPGTDPGSVRYYKDVTVDFGGGQTVEIRYERFYTGSMWWDDEEYPCWSTRWKRKK